MTRQAVEGCFVRADQRGASEDPPTKEVSFAKRARGPEKPLRPHHAPVAGATGFLGPRNPSSASTKRIRCWECVPLSAQASTLTKSSSAFHAARCHSWYG
jgi:hypothetical protein